MKALTYQLDGEVEEKADRAIDVRVAFSLKNSMSTRLSQEVGTDIHSLVVAVRIGVRDIEDDLLAEGAPIRGVSKTSWRG